MRHHNFAAGLDCLTDPLRSSASIFGIVVLCGAFEYNARGARAEVLDSLQWLMRRNLDLFIGSGYRRVVFVTFAALIK